MSSNRRILGIILLEILILSYLPHIGVKAADTDSQTINSSGSIIFVYRYIVALDGSGDFNDIQSAIDAVPTGEKGIIEVRAGIYDLNPNYKYPFKSIVPRSNINIIGAGIDSTIIRSFPEIQSEGSNRRTPVFYSTGTIQGFVLENCTLIQSGTPDNKGWNAIDLRGENIDVILRNLKITDVTGAGISIERFSNLIVENCIIERAFTGITVAGGSNGLIQGNTIIGMEGDAIFPQTHSSTIPVSDLLIIDNYMQDIGDTGIDITSNNQGPPHTNITAVGNRMINAHIRVSNAHNIRILNNELSYGKSWIDVDGGAGMPIDVLIEGNTITSSRKAGIGLFGAKDSVVLNNIVTMLPPTQGEIQRGITAAVWGNLVIEGNFISNPSNYGIDFGDWSIGNNQIVIRNNTITNFGEIGIYDDAKKQGSVTIEDNLIYDSNDPFVSSFGIRTDFEANAWIIRYNHIYAGSVEPISAPSSNVYDNSYEPI